MLVNTYHFFRDIVAHRSLIYELAKRDYQQQYMGSYLGFIWLYVQPLLYVSILFYVFTFGFRAGVTTDVPFDLYLISGMVPWLYFSGNLIRNANVLNAHSFMIKKINFRLSVLPIVQLLSSAIPHFVLVAMVVIVAWYKGYTPSLYVLQLLYYFLCMVFLLLGLSWLTASTSLFVADVRKIVMVVVQFGFWLTPIFWSAGMLPDDLSWVVTVNPINYVVMGYRDAIFLNQPFWSRPIEMMYFWGFTTLILLIGISVFRRLRPHFAEVA